MIIRCKNKRILHALAAVLLCVSLTVCLAACGVKQGKVTRWFKTVVDEDGYPSSAEYHEAFDKELSVEGLPGITFTIKNTEEFGPRLFMIKDGKDGKLLVIQRGAMSDRDKILKEGPLQLKDGELKIGK